MLSFPVLPAAFTRMPSLTARLGLSFGVAVTLALAGVSATMVLELAQQLQGKEETELRTDLRLQAAMLAALGQRRVPGNWEREWRESANADGRFAWQLLGPDGRVRAASPNAAAFVQALQNAGLPPRRVLLVDSIRGDRIAGAGSTLRGILDVSQDRQLLDAYCARLAGVALGAIAVATVLSWVLARCALAPLQAIGARAAGIDLERLHVRIGAARWPRELAPLAVAFDALLARLEHSFDELTRFSSDLAHEFRAPINNLVAAASVTLARPRAPAEYQDALAIVVDEGTRLSRMVASLVFLARVNNGRQVPRRERVALAAEYRSLVAYFGIEADERGIRLESHGAGTLYADPALLRRALSHLLANALRHTCRGGTVRLLASHAGDGVTLTVVDDGAGIGAAHLPFVFERFYRVDPARSAADSSGLGLAVVRAIVELHGGSVAVASSAGQGARFTLRFPSGPVSGLHHLQAHENHFA